MFYLFFLHPSPPRDKATFEPQLPLQYQLYCSKQDFFLQNIGIPQHLGEVGPANSAQNPSLSCKRIWHRTGPVVLWKLPWKFIQGVLYNVKYCMKSGWWRWGRYKNHTGWFTLSVVGWYSAKDSERSHVTPLGWLDFCCLGSHMIP